jgi:hypothetical protein
MKKHDRSDWTLQERFKNQVRGHASHQKVLTTYILVLMSDGKEYSFKREILERFVNMTGRSKKTFCYKGFNIQCIDRFVCFKRHDIVGMIKLEFKW